MVHEQLSADEQAIILRCMMILATTIWFEDREIHSRVGFTKQEIAEMVEAWPRFNGWRPEWVNYAIHNCVGEFVYELPEKTAAHYNLPLHGTKAVFEKWLRLDPKFPQSEGA